MDAIVYDKIGKEAQKLKDMLLGLYPQESIENAPVAIASFDDGSDGMPIKALTVNIEPVQTGTGDPSPTNVRPISGWTGANVNRTGVNVWDEDWTTGVWNQSTGTFVPDNVHIAPNDKIPCSQNTTYWVASPSLVYPSFFDINGNFIGYASSLKNASFTTPANCYYFAFYVDSGYGLTYNHNISFNYPSTDHDYHPGTDNATIPISWQSEAGTVYGGTLDVTTGVLTVTDETTQYTGNEDWFTSSDYRFYIAGQTEIIRSNQYRMLEAKVDYASEIPSGAIGQTLNGPSYVSDERFNSSAEWKSHLSDLYNSGTPVQVIRKLSTPMTYHLTPTEVITLLGQNNIWADTGDVTKLTYRADLGMYVNKSIAASAANVLNS